MRWAVFVECAVDLHPIRWVSHWQGVPDLWWPDTCRQGHLQLLRAVGRKPLSPAWLASGKGTGFSPLERWPA